MTEIRIPPRGRAVNVEMAEKLVKAVWFGNADDPPDKFVVLVDVDGKNPDEVVRPLKEQLPGRLGNEVQATVLIAYAQWHLEAWYFADSTNLREYHGRAPSATSRPDEIQNSKHHLKNLLGDRVYTAVTSEEIAKTLNPQTIAQRSPSFTGFLDAVKNGDVATQANGAA